jgi:hypothetical protein
MEERLARQEARQGGRRRDGSTVPVLDRIRRNFFG